jgi:hypothetical protein
VCVLLYIDRNREAERQERRVCECVLLHRETERERESVCVCVLLYTTRERKRERERERERQRVCVFVCRSAERVGEGGEEGGGVQIDAASVHSGDDRSKVDTFVPQTQNVNLRTFRQATRVI